MSDIVKGKKDSLKEFDMSLNSVELKVKKNGNNREWDTLVVIADTSGSMAQSMDEHKSKIQAEIDALTYMFKKGLDGDKVILVECPGSNGYPESHMPTTSPSILIDIVATMSADWSTPMYESLELAYKKASDSKARFILMSDGMPTDAAQDDIFELVKAEGVVIDTVGIGNPNRSHSYDPEFLKEVARITGGIYSEVHNYEGFIKKMYELSPVMRKQLTDGKKGGAIAL